MPLLPQPRRGEVWFASLDPIRGHEQGGTHPVLVVSVDRFNFGPTELCVVLPLSSRPKISALHVGVEPPEGGLVVRSYIRCEDVRSITRERLIRQLGSVSPLTLATVEARLRQVLGL
jgi:mRNA interferase MazF